jgi:hypothetical protein
MRQTDARLNVAGELGRLQRSLLGEHDSLLCLVAHSGQE